LRTSQSSICQDYPEITGPQLRRPNRTVWHSAAPARPMRPHLTGNSFEDLPCQFRGFGLHARQINTFQPEPLRSTSPRERTVEVRQHFGRATVRDENQPLASDQSTRCKSARHVSRGTNFLANPGPKRASLARVHRKFIPRTTIAVRRCRTSRRETSQETIPVHNRNATVRQLA